MCVSLFADFPLCASNCRHARHGGGLLVGGEMISGFFKPDADFGKSFFEGGIGEMITFAFGNVTENMAKELQNIVDVSFVDEVKRLVEQGRSAAYGAVNAIMIETYWRIGQRIVEQEQKGKERAEYGTQLIELLSAELTRSYGKGFSTRNLWLFKRFYLTFNSLEILHTRVQNLIWSHIRTTLRVDNEIAARWYLQTASEEMWSVRTLDRNISTQYFERHFKQPQILENPENKERPDKLEILKSPVMTEFLGFKQNTDYTTWKKA